MEHLPRRGMRVTELTATDIEQLFGIRAALERHAVECAFPMAPSPGTTRLADVRQWLDQMRQADADDDQLHKDDAHRAFHAAIVSLAGNRQLDLALEPILFKLQRPMAVNLRREAQVRARGSATTHERLVAALETNDREAVLIELAAHGSRRFLDAAAD